MSFMRGLLPKYFASEWSFAQLRLPDTSYRIVGFGQQENTLIIIVLQGTYMKCVFDPVRGGEMARLAVSNIVTGGEDASAQ